MNALAKIPTPEPVAGLLARIGIESVTLSHPAVFTVGEGEHFRHLIPGGHTKNLFLKDKKGVLWLVTAQQETLIDLKWLPKRLAASGRLSFASPELLQARLGVTPGSVTALALMNDKDKAVRPVLDYRLLEHDFVNCHPLRNDMTTQITPQDLLKFMAHLGYSPVIVDFEDGCAK